MKHLLPSTSVNPLLTEEKPEEENTVGAWCVHLFRDRLLSGDNEQLHLGNPNPGAHIFLSVCPRASRQWPIQAATPPFLVSVRYVAQQTSRHDCLSSGLH